MMKLRKVAGPCEDGPCPAVYETERGTYIVQGAVVAREEIGQVHVPSHETVVEIPRDLLVGLAESLRA